MIEIKVGDYVILAYPYNPPDNFLGIPKRYVNKKFQVHSIFPNPSARRTRVYIMSNDDRIFSVRLSMLKRAPTTVTDVLKERVSSRKANALQSSDAITDTLVALVIRRGGDLRDT